MTGELREGAIDCPIGQNAKTAWSVATGDSVVTVSIIVDARGFAALDQEDAHRGMSVKKSMT
jgi:hypothetical protein